MTAEPYTDELTPGDAKLGFILAYVANPKVDYMGHGTLAPAVILPLGPSSRIAKLFNPGKQTTYRHEIYGTYRGGIDPGWAPVSMGDENASRVISAAKSGVVVERVDPMRSKITLTCPRCTREFIVEADYLQIDGTTTCVGAECAYTAKTEEFNAPNV